MPKEITISDDGFINMLTNLGKKQLVEELDKTLINAIQAIGDFGGTAEIKLNLKLKRIKSVRSAVSIVHDVVAKIPEEPREDDALFVTAGHGLVNQFQEQSSLDLQHSDKERQSLQQADSKVTSLDEARKNDD